MRREQQRREVDLLLEAGDLGEALLKWHGEQEGEENLDSGQRDAQLLEQLAEVAVEALGLALVSARGAVAHLSIAMGHTLTRPP